MQERVKEGRNIQNWIWEIVRLIGIVRKNRKKSVHLPKITIVQIGGEMEVTFFSL